MLKTFGSAIISMRCHVTPCCLNITYGTRSALLSWVLYQRHRTSHCVPDPHRIFMVLSGPVLCDMVCNGAATDRESSLCVLYEHATPCGCHLAGGASQSAGAAVISIQTPDRGCVCSCTPQYTLVHIMFIFTAILAADFELRQIFVYFNFV